MKLDQLSYFVETARYEHIGKAAKSLAISPSAISHSIRSLEEELGRELFEKQGKNIILSDYGRLLLERAETLLQDVEQIKSDIASEKVKLRGKLRLGASHGLSTNILAPALAAVQSQHEHLSVEALTLRSSQVVQAVVSGEIDLGICYSPQEHPNLLSKVIYQGQLKLFLSAKHPLWKQNKIDLSALSQYSAVLPKAFQGIEVCEMHPMFEKFKIRPDANFLFDSYEVGVEKLYRSQAWGLMPDFFAALFPKKIKAIKPGALWKAPFTISMVIGRNRFQTRAIDLIMEQMQLNLTKLIKKTY